MMAIEKITDLIKTELAELESSVAGRKAAIEKAYKEALATAEQNKKEALKEFEKEIQTIDRLKMTLKSLIAEPINPKNSISKSKPLVVPTKWDSKLTSNAKIAFALHELGSGFNEDIAGVIAKYDNVDIDKASKNLSGILSTLKGKRLINVVEKVGRKDKYSLI